uniref:Uncharacterized protein n=2 Tax=viral metagenome TaxID=1070528 RepID=A0A6M3J423_9ZZZZ
MPLQNGTKGESMEENKTFVKHVRITPSMQSEIARYLQEQEMTFSQMVRVALSLLLAIESVDDNDEEKEHE